MGYDQNTLVVGVHENKHFRYVELDAGDHYLSIQTNRHRLFAEMDAFLKTYL